MNQTESSANDNNPKPSITGETSAVPEWITETINNGSLRHVDLHTGSNGWASPPGDVFSLRSANYFTNKQKSPGGDYLLSPAGVDWLQGHGPDWLKSPTKLDNLLARPDNRVAHSLRQAQARGESRNSFIFAVNFQVSGKEHYNLRLKLVSQILKRRQGSSGRSLSERHWAILSAFVRLLLGYARSFTVDVGLVIEAQTEDELPERLIGAVRMCHVELASAFVVQPLASEPCLMMGSAE
ncbi:BnaA09g04720D [Brassica napus]|uniref:BnaA09g04720D protein n=1 Tax=Brassica napus TaxID=3708 RepID=A0A078G313_BRANA|nr:BnaA09g04720D [Brassica napus]